MHVIDVMVIVGILMLLSVVVAIYCRRLYYSGVEWLLSWLDWSVTQIVVYSPTEVGKMIIQVILANGKRKGRKSDAILTDAISIGGLKLIELFSWTTAEGNINGGPKQTSWQEAKQRNAQFVSELLHSVKPSTNGPPIIPLISGTSRYDTLRRCLAFREFHLIATAKNNALGLKRKQLFTRGDGKWPQLVYASMGVLDMVTLQLQLVVAYGVKELLTSDRTAREQIQGVNPRVRNVLDAIKTSEWGAVASHWGGDISWDAMEVVKKGQELRKKGWLLIYLNEWMFNQPAVVVSPTSHPRYYNGWVEYLRKKSLISTWLLNLPSRVIKASFAAGKENMPVGISKLAIWRLPEDIGKWIEKRRKNVISCVNIALSVLPLPMQRWCNGISTIKVDPLAPALVRSAVYSAGSSNAIFPSSSPLIPALKHKIPFKRIPSHHPHSTTPLSSKTLSSPPSHHIPPPLNPL